MSILPNQTYVNPSLEFYVNDVPDIQFISSINVPNGTINTSQINLDSVRMDCAVINSVPTLLLNGVPVAATSSFTSSVTQWASYPALAPINYASGVGTGGAINMANVNALTNVSSASGYFGTVTSVGNLNGVPFPNPGTPIAGMAQSIVVSGGGLLGAFNFTGQAAGLYMVQILLQTGGADPGTCSAIIRYSGGTATGGCFHMPSISGNSPPSTANCVSFQSDNANDPYIQVYVFTNNPALVGSTAQLSCYRIT